MVTLYNKAFPRICGNEPLGMRPKLACLPYSNFYVAQRRVGDSLLDINHHSALVSKYVLSENCLEYLRANCFDILKLKAYSETVQVEV